MSIEQQIADVAATIRHCGDYGDVFWNADQKKVHWTGGDADFDEEYGYTRYDDTIARFKAIDGVEEVEIGDEWAPNDDDGEVQSGWTEIHYDQKPNNQFQYDQVLAEYAGRQQEVPEYIHQIYGRGL